MAASFSVPKMPAKSSDVATALETSVANKIKGPKTTPGGWSKGTKTGWGGAGVPPGLARVRAAQAAGTTPANTTPKPNMNDQGLATRPTKVKRKPLEGA